MPKERKEIKITMERITESVGKNLWKESTHLKMKAIKK
jgi:hypothetical protein